VTDVAQEAIRAAILVASTAPHRIQPPIGYYLPALASARGVARIAVSDPTGESDAVLGRAGTGGPPIERFRDHARMLAEVRPDLAIVTAPPFAAPPLIRAALEAGAHVMADKPGAVRLADFAGLTRLSAERRRHLMLAFGNRFSPLVAEARRLVRTGALGRLYAADAGTFSDQGRLREPAYPGSWHARKASAGGGHLVYLGIHYVDLLQFLTGEEIRRVAGFTRNVGGAPIEVEDAAAVVLELAGGALCTLQTGYYLDRGNLGWITLWGSGGWLRIQLIPDPSLEWHSTRPGMPAGIERRADTSDFMSRQYAPFIQAAVDAARGAGAAPVTAAEGLSVLAAIFAAYRAAESGRAEQVDRG
jgi:predicted dehydrogenase